ncbi:nucleotidyltransferase domain-containing protein [Natrarchaeobius chitinivorans]|uniref:Nucleotidyltransferase family protein n=1 Tax=Natrarchaeobius chitinivorans TaxID=1679083 RepID=A0A3N6LY82_NATCH|nr:nucleotidyltransferase family protein [Natrarchaeobius chitinivorans]RQG94017.1 hypothetical protein EA473_13140 [Natrarchaeobius chitinivorans]
MTRRFGDEERFVIRCCKAGIRGTSVRPNWFESGLDWETVCRLTRRHCVTPLFLEAVRHEREETVPPEALETLEERSAYVARRNLRLLQTTASLSQAFEREGIRAIPYRGPVLARIAYGDVGRREFGDLDVLVRRTDLPAARSVLLEQGYDPQYVRETTDGLTSSQQWAYTRFARDYAFEHRCEPVEVELHWRVLARRFPTAIELESVWDRRSTTSIAGTDVPVLSPEDRLLSCCVHGTRHRWDRLRWICDVAADLERNSIDWETVIRRSESHNCTRMLLLGLAVTASLFETQLPVRVRRRIDADPAIEPLRLHVRDHLFDDSAYPEHELWRFQSRTLERYRDRGTFWATCLFEPTRPDIEAVSLPRPLAPLYSLVRCGRLLRTAIGRRPRSRGETDSNPSRTNANP